MARTVLATMLARLEDGTLPALPEAPIERPPLTSTPKAGPAPAGSGPQQPPGGGPLATASGR
jgi:hypothetical protein